MIVATVVGFCRETRSDSCGECSSSIPIGKINSV